MVNFLSTFSLEIRIYYTISVRSEKPFFSLFSFGEKKKNVSSNLLLVLMHY